MNSIRPILKALTALAISAMATLAPLSQAQTTGTAAGPDISFLNNVYSLVWAADPTPNYSKSEYLPAGESLPYYNNMLLVERMSGVSVTDTVRAQVRFIQERRETDAGAKIFDLIENPNTGEVLLVFALTAPDKDREIIWEWNTYRYSPVQTSNGERGVRLFGYSVRTYGNDERVYDFLEEIDNKRSEFINAVANAKIP